MAHRRLVPLFCICLGSVACTVDEAGERTSVGQSRLTSGVIPLVGDFDGDGRAEPAVFDPADGRWYFGSNAAGTTRASAPTGLRAGLRAAAADFNGDHVTDVLLVDDSTAGGARWYVVDGRTGALGVPEGPWGTQWSGMGAEHRLALGDFDGDGKTDRAILVDEAGGARWYIIPSSLGYGGVGTAQTPWGWQWPGLGTAHELVLGDYDGDGITDKAIVDRAGGALWYVIPSTLGYGGVGTPQIPWGSAWAGWGNARIALGDYDGDHRLDRAIVDDSDPAGAHFNIIPSALGYGGVGTPEIPWDTVWRGFGPDATLALGDYDGDGKTDAAMITNDCRTYVVSSATGGYGAGRVVWGFPLLTPTCAAYAAPVRGPLEGSFDHCPTSATPANPQRSSSNADLAVVSWYGDSKTVGACVPASGGIATLDTPVPWRVDQLAGGRLAPRQRARNSMSLATLDLGLDGLNGPSWDAQIDADPSPVVVIAHGTNDSSSDLHEGIPIGVFEARLTRMVTKAKLAPAVSPGLQRTVVLMEPYRACTTYQSVTADELLTPYVAAINRVAQQTQVEVIHAYALPISCPRDEPDGIHGSQELANRVAQLAYEVLRRHAAP